MGSILLSDCLSKMVSLFDKRRSPLRPEPDKSWDDRRPRMSLLVEFKFSSLKEHIDMKLFKLRELDDSREKTVRE